MSNWRVDLALYNELKLLSMLLKLFTLIVEDVILRTEEVLDVVQPAVHPAQRNRHFWPDVVLPDPVEDAHADQGEVHHVDEDGSPVLSVLPFAVPRSQVIDQLDQVALKGGHSLL